MLPRWNFPWLALWTCLLVCSACFQVRGGDDRTRQIDALFAPWDRKDSPGCAVVVIHRGSIVHERGYGMANLELGVPITPRTAFNIASVSKQFTAFLILLLASAGLLDLDADVRTYVPEVPDFGKTITVRQLMHHTSGLREEWDMLILAGFRAEDSIVRGDTLRLLTRQKQLNFEPGAEYSYCNTGYTLLAEIIERVGKKSIRAAARESIFDPLGMNDSVFQDVPRQIIPGRAMSYRPAGKSFETVPYATGRAGPGNLYSTALDLAKWDANVYEPKVGAKVLPQTTIKAKLNGGKEITYAAGLQVTSYRGLKVVTHSGAIAGYRSVLARFPEERFTVIVLANVSDFDAAGMGKKIADICLSDRFETDVPKEPLKKKEPPTVALPSESLSPMVGTYYSRELDTFYRIDIREGGLVLQHRRGESKLRPIGENMFRGDIGVPVTIRFLHGGKKTSPGLFVSTERSRNLSFRRAEIKVE